MLILVSFKEIYQEENWLTNIAEKAEDSESQCNKMINKIQYKQAKCDIPKLRPQVLIP